MTKRKDAESRVVELETELRAVKHDLSVVGDEKSLLTKELLTAQAQIITLQADVAFAEGAKAEAEAKVGYVPTDTVEECILYLDTFVVDTDSDQARGLADQARGQLSELQRRRAFEATGKTGVSA